MLSELFKDLNLEVLIVKLQCNRFKASSPIFPNCKGLGATSDQALEKLVVSISNYVSGELKCLLMQFFSGKNYAEIITNINSQEDFQHRVYSLDKKSKLQEKKVYLKSLESVLSSFSSVGGVPSVDKSPFELFFEQKKGTDGPILGISLCLN